MMDEILKTIVDNYNELQDKREIFKELLNELDLYLESHNIDKDLEIKIRKSLELGNYSDDRLLELAYINNYKEIDKTRDHIYVYLASFIRSSHVLFPDACVTRTTPNADFSVYADLIGTDTRIEIPCEERLQFESSNEILYLSDFDSYMKYYEMRLDYLKDSLKVGSYYALEKAKVKNRKEMN